MSVSNRSPTTRGARKSPRATASCSSRGAGLPATRGSAPVAARSAATNDPFPGSRPRSVGRVGSTLAATHSAPARMASAASARSGQPMVVDSPCTTATGSSSYRRTGRSPTAATSSASASVPTIRTRDSGGNWSASSRAALWALVTTSVPVAVKPRSRRCDATSSALREALLVTYSLRLLTSSSEWTAPSVGWAPRKTVPSRSTSKQSYCCAMFFISRELADALFGVGDAVDIGSRRAQEPFQRLVIAAERQQRVGVGVEQPRRRRAVAARVQLRRGQQGQRLLQLPEVRAGAGGDDAQLVGVVAGQLGRLRPARQFDRPLRTATPAFTIGDQREQRRFAAHPAGGAQFGQRLGPVAAVVGGDSDGLADRGDPAGPGPRRAGVFQRGLGVLVDQLAGRDQVARHRVGRDAVQRAQLATDFGRQLFGLDAGRYRWPTGRVVRHAIPRGVLAAARLHRPGAPGTGPGAGCRARSSPTALPLPVVDHPAKDTGAPAAPPMSVR